MANRYQDDEPLEEVHSSEDFTDEEVENLRKKKPNKVKILLPLIFIGIIIIGIGGMYTYQSIINANFSTPVADIPEPRDTIITGGEDINQVDLAEAQIKKEENKLEQKVVQDEELTRVNFAPNLTSKTEVRHNKQVNYKKSNVDENTAEIGNNVAIPRQVNTPPVRQRSIPGKSGVKIDRELKVESNNDPFNIVMGNIKPKNKRVGSIQEIDNKKETTTYDEYLKSYTTQQEEEPVPGVILGRQKITPGQTIAIKLTKDMSLKGFTISKGTIVYGLPTIDNGRINIKVSNIKKGSSLLRANLTVLGEDMNEGVQYSVRGKTDLSGTKGAVIDAATSRLGTVGSILGGLGRSTTERNDPQYVLEDGTKVYLLNN